MEVFPVRGLPDITPGDDLGAMIEARVDLAPTDILAVASTVVSKAEDRRAALDAFDPGPRARAVAERLEAVTGDPKDPRFAQAVLEESAETLMEAPFLLTRLPFGHTGVNAGIDRSNTGGADLLLLPEDPDASAARIRGNVPGEPGVVVTDTSGRPFRHGQVGVAIGWAGIPASRDWRGRPDRDGRELTVTVESVVDEAAAAANLVTGEGDGGTPVAVVRDLELDRIAGSDQLFRDRETDFVREALLEWTYEPGPH